MTAKIIDNSRVSLASVLNELAPKFNEIAIATGYLDVQGIALLLPSIRQYSSIRILIGQEPLPAAYRGDELQLMLDDTFPENQLAASLARNDYLTEVTDVVAEIKNLIQLGSLEIRVYRGSFLHAKTYIFGSFTSAEAVGIIGSSNFTAAGLTRNLELNALEEESRIVKFTPRVESDEHGHLSWFEEIWNDEKSEIWNGSFTQVLENSPVGALAFSPYHMYIRALYEVFSHELVDEADATGVPSDVLYEFQQRNAKLLLNKLRRSGLAMLADSVGLGKTITAGEVIRTYIEEREAKRIYVIAPASLISQWKSDLMRVHRLFGGYQVISMQDVPKIKKEREFDDFKSVDLFVVDEAHNLRNGSGVRHDELLEWFSDNPGSHVLLLTATPINNSLNDFVNQIQLAGKGRLESFPVIYPSATKNETLDFFEAVGRLISDAKRAEKRGERPDYKRANVIMRQGLSRFLVRSTRQGIEREFGGIRLQDGSMRKFPKSVVKPQPYKFSTHLMDEFERVILDNSRVFDGVNPTELVVESLLIQTQRSKHPLNQLDEVLRQVGKTPTPFETIFQILLLLGFAPYKWDLYRRRFYGKTADELKEFELGADEKFRLNSQLSIHNMLRVTLLKRFESSHFALKRSLQNYREKLENFTQLLSEGLIVPISDIRELRATYGDDLEGIDAESLELDEDVKVISADKDEFNLEALRRDLERDEKLLGVLDELCDLLGQNDDKLNAFVSLFRELAQADTARGKVLVFSYFADTIEYLRAQLPNRLAEFDMERRAGFVTGANKTAVEQFARRFSPKSKGVADIDRNDELQFLFSTDVLSEGQNLQDCACLINFDLHWNPVRMIQRNGRVNRLGSEFDSVKIFNLHPEIDLDEYLALVERLERKIDQISSTIGTDTSILGELENPIEYISDIYDDAKATDAFAALDDDDALLSEDEFIRDLRDFERSASDSERAAVKSIPAGKWGLFPSVGRLGRELAALGLIKVEGLIEDDQSRWETSVFVEVTKTLQPIPTIDALHMIRATPANSSRVIEDFRGLDRTTIRSRCRKIAERHAQVTPTHFRVTASISRVLDKLHEVSPALDVRLALNRIRTKPELRYATRLFREASRELKTSPRLSRATTEEFEMLVQRLEDVPQFEKIPSRTTGVLFFAK